MLLRSLVVSLLLCLACGGEALAQAAPFDLSGPRLKVTVTRGEETLPITQVPDLAAGDRLWIKAELPASQSVRYLLVAAFLRGATNPPPKEWFHRARTWTKAERDGLRITVPEGARQVVVFLAPKTGGDFKTLMDAVSGRPGVFVRASQDLNQAALDRSRLDAFLAALRKDGPADPGRLKAITPLLARSLTIKLNTDCFQKMPELQAACLMQGRDALVLNDGHSTSIVDALTTGNVGDLSVQLSVTPQAGYGYYSSYIGAIRDIARILDSLHTAEYQYIPALATMHGDELALLLNTAPSFHNPKSVLVTALPAVEPAQPPPQQPVDAKAAYCLTDPDLVLPAEGAPLVYSTRYAHDLKLRVKTRAGTSLELAAQADAERGGLTIDRSGLKPAEIQSGEAVLHGSWGFHDFEGPGFELQVPRPGAWTLDGEDRDGAVVGRSDPVRIEGGSASCVEAVSLRMPDGQVRPLEWKATRPDQVTATLPLTDAEPGAMALLVRRSGADKPEEIAVQALAKAGRIEGFDVHAGDLGGVLKGARLDEVAGLTLAGVDFAPGALSSAGGGDALAMTTADAGRLRAGQASTAKVKLKDGRTVSLKVKVGPPRPQVELIGKTVQADAAAAPHAIRLAGPDEAAEGARIVFSVRALAPLAFSGEEALEVANADATSSATLTFKDGLALEDAKVLLATLDTAKAFDHAVFGPLRFRLVKDGAAGDWRPLVRLVRLPELQALTCAPGAGGGCQLKGQRLFLIDSVAADPAFSRPVKVPEGFTGQALAVPRAVSGKLYVKLRDDPEAINEVSLPVTTAKPAARRSRSG
jgi:hypothetical protein